jgi:hypothetical protein
MPELMLLSNSFSPGRGALGHAVDAPAAFFTGARQVLFVPYAASDPDAHPVAGPRDGPPGAHATGDRASSWKKTCPCSASARAPGCRCPAPGPRWAAPSAAGYSPAGMPPATCSPAMTSPPSCAPAAATTHRPAQRRAEPPASTGGHGRSTPSGGAEVAAGHAMVLDENGCSRSSCTCDSACGF